MRTFSVPRVLSLAVLLLAACGDDGSGEPDGATDTGVETDAGSSDAVSDGDGDGDGGQEPLVIDWTDHNDDCDPLDPGHCAMPWPSSLYLEDDATRATGYTLAFGDSTLGANFRDVPVEPDIYRRLDGFSLGTPLIVKFPNIDTDGMATDWSVERSLADDAPILWYEVQDDGSLERVPYWVELDAWTDDPDEQVLWVRSGRILDSATRYVVAFRDLTRTDGTVIEPSPAFDALRRGEGANHPPLADRQARFDEIFALLDTEGVAREDLVLAWDFVTGSSESLHGRMLEMRELAMSAVGDDGAEITVDTVEEFTEDENEHWWLILRGTFRAPHYMETDVVSDPSGEFTGWTFHLDDEGNVIQNGWRDADFWIGVPHSAKDGTPHGLAQYGHGFFGLADGTTGRWSNNGAIANEYNYIFFGCNWTGMAEEDFGSAQFAVFDLNHFHWIPDRLHQGMMEFLVFARGMRERFGGLEEVTSRSIGVNTDDLVYVGISQGGINGATYMALTQDITYGHLGVPGANYGLMEHRSTNFDQFFVALNGAYSGRDNQAILLMTVQLLWDTTDPITYWPHITAQPFEDDEPRYVIAAPSRGDRQVTTLSMEVVARSEVGLAVMENYDTERSIPATQETPYPHTGSGLVLWNYGNEWPPEATNLPAPEHAGENAHNGPRFDEDHNRQMVHFFRNGGEIIDVCGGAPCSR